MFGDRGHAKRAIMWAAIFYSPWFPPWSKVTIPVFKVEAVAARFGLRFLLISVPLGRHDAGVA
jgi:hypothetical protein